MISVQNRLQLSNGNKYIIFLTALLFSACSPKLRPVIAPVKRPDTVAVALIKPPPIAPPPKVSVISLLLPFGLNHIGPGNSYSEAGLRKARIAADFYTGFKFALDSLTYYGYNYKLLVFDSQDEPAQVNRLAYNAQIRTSDLIVGPVFPEDIKAFSDVLIDKKKVIVSPLSPEPPATFKNPNLITVNPPLAYHAWNVARYINDKMQPQKIFILKSGFSEENDYIDPFTDAINSLSGGHIKIITLTVIRGDLRPIMAQLSANRQNVFIIAATDENFLTVTLRSLDALNKTYPVTLFGHPGWQHFTFLGADVLQRLQTHITSADEVDYKSPETITFIRGYRKVYHAEPSNYAIKGFDEGLYFGGLLAKDELKNMGRTDFTGLHNNFHFVEKAGTGWINSHVDLLLYTNFELKQAE